VNYHDPNLRSPAYPHLEGVADTQTPFGAENGLAWPPYTSESDLVYTFNDEGPPYLSRDDFRKEAIQVLTELAIAHPIF